MSLPEAIQPDGATHVRYRGRRLIYFGGCDYYRLAHHPKLLKAHAQATARDGLGTGASRMTTGNHPAHDKLETSLVKFFGSETATVVGDGYLANIALGQAANGRFDAAFIDEKAHMSLRDAAQFIGCPVVRYRHCNADDLARRVSRRRAAKRVLLMTDGVFGATGRGAPVGDLAKRLARSVDRRRPRRGRAGRPAARHRRAVRFGRPARDSVDHIQQSAREFWGCDLGAALATGRAARRQQRRYQQQFVASRLGQGHARVA